MHKSWKICLHGSSIVASPPNLKSTQQIEHFFCFFNFFLVISTSMHCFSSAYCDARGFFLFDGMGTMPLPSMLLLFMLLLFPMPDNDCKSIAINCSCCWSVRSL